MRVVWTDPAEEDRERIVLFIAEDNPLAAVEMDELFVATGDSLATLSARGRPGKIPDTRELVVHKNYLLVYGFDDDADTVYIKAVLHASQLWPPE